MTLTCVRFALAATVNRTCWLEEEASDRPESTVPFYLLTALRHGADRLVELGARIYLADQPTTKADPREHWPTVLVPLLVDVDEQAWASHYGRPVLTGVPPYAAHIAWQSPAFSRGGGTVELITYPA